MSTTCWETWRRASWRRVTRCCGAAGPWWSWDGCRGSWVWSTAVAPACCCRHCGTSMLRPRPRPRWLATRPRLRPAAEAADSGVSSDWASCPVNWVRSQTPALMTSCSHDVCRWRVDQQQVNRTRPSRLVVRCYCDPHDLHSTRTSDHKYSDRKSNKTRKKLGSMSTYYAAVRQATCIHYTVQS